MPTVIGLHGAKGSGKDYFFHILKASRPDHPISKIAFADPIKLKVMFLFGLRTESEYDQFKRTNLNYTVLGRDVHQAGRHVVREVGMMMREYDPGQFIRYVEQHINNSPDKIWCITDLRFPNEFQFLKNVFNGTIIKIKRKGFEFDGHASETEFPDEVCDHIIQNETNDIVAYGKTVCGLYDAIRGK